MLLAICEENHWSLVDSPHKGHWRGTLMFSLICAWTNGWANNWNTSDFSHPTHYDVSVMEYQSLFMWGLCRKVTMIYWECIVFIVGTVNDRITFMACMDCPMFARAFSVGCFLGFSIIWWLIKGLWDIALKCHTVSSGIISSNISLQGAVLL